MKISHRLFLSFALVICLSVVVGVVGVIGIQNLQRSGTAMHEEHIVGMDNLGVAIGYMKQSTIDLMNVTISSLYDDRHGALAAQAQFESSVSGFESALSGAITISELDILYQPIIAEFRDTYLPNSRRVMELSIANIPDHARMLDVNVLMAVNAESTERLNRLIDSLSDAHTAIADYSISINERQTTIFTAMQWGFLAATIALGVLLSISITRRISKPVTFLRDSFEVMAKGEITISDKEEMLLKKYGAQKDEFGEMMINCREMLLYLIEVVEKIEQLSNGNLDISIQVRSEIDVVGPALQKVVDNLSSMFAEINMASTQVASGSRQIADGSSSLAQGSNEQAASVQQLSASISDIAQKTKNSADMAEKAAMLANDIKTSAEKGSRQMDEMMDAVKEINASSQNISKVIKSIDDIAFQTNILALNAAVEAARAGQHGKGFAVVAEEVRNLAAKSAEAAKDTESLIADSIQKAELGSRIADETAASLTEIVAGIGESNQLITEIAKSSDEQSAGIAQINKGIDQVAKVTQQNSATAEESAAASQEMSGQSNMLEQLIARFKLKDAGNFDSLSPSEPLKASEQLEFQNVPDEDYGKY